jgi:dihydrofolate reductase
MGKVLIDMSMSLDGYATGPNDRPEEGLGDGGMRLHDWGWSNVTEADTNLQNEALSAVGAIICGRRTYDNSVKYWGLKKGPHGDTPVFVVSHGVHEEGLGEGSPITFVNGIEKALELAQKAAGDKDIRLMGANVPQQFLKAGLVDEVFIHLVPVMMGGGQKMFDNLGPDVELRPIEVVDSPNVTHLRWRVVR